jgi:tetratricopeptide (TPR) repeat protein
MPIERDFDNLWNYSQPRETEAAFRHLLDSEAAKDRDYRLELLTQIARCQGLQQKFIEAHKILDHVEGESPAGRTLARLLLERGRAVNSGGDPAGSIPIFLEALEVAQAAGEENLAVDAAHMLGIAEDPEASLAWNLKAIDMAQAANEPNARRWLGSLYNNTGWTLHNAGRFDEALRLFENAVAFEAREQRPERWRIARWTVARCHRSLGRVEEALAEQFRLLQDRKDDSPYVNEEIGECLLFQGKAEEAKPYFAEAYRLLRDDPWLKRDEPERLERMKSLAGGD